jgi:hypothetical protein
VRWIYQVCSDGLSINLMWRKLIRPSMSAARAANPPSANPQRGPTASANQPTAGTPIFVVPRKAIDQNDITRPRIWGKLPYWTILFPSDEK